MLWNMSMYLKINSNITIIYNSGDECPPLIQWRSDVGVIGAVIYKRDTDIPQKNTPRTMKMAKIRCTAPWFAWFVSAVFFPRE